MYLGRDAAGKVRHRSVLFRGTKRSAQWELTRLAAEQDRAGGGPRRRRTDLGPTAIVYDAIGAWKANGWDDLSPRTARRYEGV